MKLRDKVYHVEFKNGLMHPLDLHLTEDEDPAKAALAEFRRRRGEVNLLSTHKVEEVVASISPVME